MIVFDTNLISEGLKLLPSRKVAEWISAQPLRTIYTTSITQAEMLYGIETMPRGKRRDALASAVAGYFDTAFLNRILPFDERAARLYGNLVVTRERRGRPIDQPDAMMAAICRVHGATLATRNTPDFEHCGIQLVNPWTH